MNKHSTAWIPNCKEAHQLCSERLDRKLGIIESAGLRLHLMICVACTNVSQQMDLLHRAMQDMPLDDMPLDNPVGEDKKPE